VLQEPQWEAGCVIYSHDGSILLTPVTSALHHSSYLPTGGAKWLAWVATKNLPRDESAA
jgi:hypothetical protein